MRRMNKFEKGGISEFVPFNIDSCDGQSKKNEQSRLCGTLGEKWGGVRSYGLKRTS